MAEQTHQTELSNQLTDGRATIKPIGRTERATPPSHVWQMLIPVFHQLRLSTEHHICVSINAPRGVSQPRSVYTSPQKPGYSSREGRDGSLKTVEWLRPLLFTGLDLHLFTAVIRTHDSNSESEACWRPVPEKHIVGGEAPTCDL